MNGREITTHCQMTRKGKKDNTELLRFLFKFPISIIVTAK